MNKEAGEAREFPEFGGNQGVWVQSDVWQNHEDHKSQTCQLDVNSLQENLSVERWCVTTIQSTRREQQYYTITRLGQDLGDRQDNHVENDLETLYLEESQKIKEIVNEEVNPTRGTEIE